MRRGIVIGFLLPSLLLASGAHAGDADSARRHFEAGKKLRDEGDCVRAIPEFDRSIAADKSIGGYYNLGYCHEQLGHRQEAYEAYKQAQQLASAKKDDRLREISGALASLLETPHIRLVLPQPLPEGIQITVDDHLVPSNLYSAETVIFTKNVKSHNVSVSAPGYEERRETVDTKQVKPIELRHASAKTAEPLPPPPPPPPKTEDGGWPWQRWTGLGIATVGVGLLTTGSVMYLSYRIDESDLSDRVTTASACAKRQAGEPHCANAIEEQRRLDARRANNENEQDARDRAPLMATLAIAGGAMIGGGLLLFLTAPKSNAPKSITTGLRVLPLVGPTTQGAALTGMF
jgi:tetratricopeptide (TPR) repeat protein